MRKQENADTSIEDFGPLISATAELLDICSQPSPQNNSFLWSEHIEIRSLLEKIEFLSVGKVRNIEADNDHRMLCLESFEKWCDFMSINRNNVRLKPFDNKGLGVATKDGNIESGLSVVVVPFKAMMSMESMRKSGLKDAMGKDPLIREMPNVALAIHLLNESLKGRESTWEPYITVLPKSYSTPLYFSMGELELLRGSVAFEESLKLWRNIARQFAYFSQLLSCDNHPLKSSCLNLKNFAFGAYRWATVTVMTRVNLVPDPFDQSPKPTLIPYVDMANHDQSLPMSLQYDESSNSAVLHASKSYDSADQEVCIFYGPRSNHEFLIHNGFIVTNNRFDFVPIRLGLSKSDRLFEGKSALLRRLNLDSNTTFKLGKNFESEHEFSELLLFALIFNAENLDQLSDIEKSIDFVDGISKINFDNLPNRKLVEKSRQFLKARLELLVKAYKIDERAAESSSNNPNFTLIARFVHEEKAVLLKAISLL